jgi:hypothetical protein
MFARWMFVLALVGCEQPAAHGKDPAPLFREIAVATEPGLSGLAADERGGLWTIAERAHRMYRIVLDAALHPTIETFTIEAVPPGLDLESIAVLAPDRFALGTEGRLDGVATVLLAERRADAIVVTNVITLPDSQIGIRLRANAGAEGICGAGGRILVGIEAIGTDQGRRWAPIIVLDDRAIVRTHRLWLTTKIGKLSGLDCWLAADGAIELLAIERHFEVTKLLRFRLPAGAGDITPTEALDLGPALHGRLNLEGVAWTAGGGVVAAVDNQWKRITGPSVLLVFPPGRVR